MKLKLIICLVLVLSGGLFGCASAPPAQSLDVRAALLFSAKKNDSNFPNGQDAVLTHFSHVGQLVTSRGEIIYVVDERAVTAGVLSPHGLNFIVFFDRHFQFLGKINYVNSRPLWCDGGKLYLFGDLDGFPNDEKNYSRGNVIDVAGGFENLKIYHAKVYGSSGGLEDP
jgi:hypothetical protein